MYNNSIEKAVDGIVFSNDTKKRIWNNITNTHKVNSRHYMKFSVAISIVCLLFMFCTNTALNSKTLITVYAMDKTGQNDSIVLSPNDPVELLEQNTSVGTGYVFILTIPDNYTYDCIAIDEKENIFSVYQNQNYIYWIPNNEILGNIYSNTNEKLETEEEVSLDRVKFKIEIYDENSKLSDEKIIEFKIDNQKCFVTLK